MTSVIQRRSSRINNKELDYFKSITKHIVSRILRVSGIPDKQLKFETICSIYINLIDSFVVMSKYRTIQSLYMFIKITQSTGNRLLLELIENNYPKLHYNQFSRIFKKYTKICRIHFTNTTYNRLLIERLFYYRLVPIAINDKNFVALIQIQFPEEIIKLILEYYM